MLYLLSLPLLQYFAAVVLSHNVRRHSSCSSSVFQRSTGCLRFQTLKASNLGNGRIVGYRRTRSYKHLQPRCSLGCSAFLEPRFRSFTEEYEGGRKLGIPQTWQQRAAAQDSVDSGNEAYQDESSGHPVNEIDEDLVSDFADSEDQVDAHAEQVEEWKNKYFRILADWENYKKRTTKERADLKPKIVSETLKEILPIIDSFRRAEEQLNPASEDAQHVQQAYSGIYKQLMNVLETMGINVINTVGELFDPNVHEAVLREESTDYEEDLITGEIQSGYRMKDEILRYALVKVSAGPGPR
eukprot:gnl/MRDRNA2_/MRDRNA2_69402_c0_seq1.p1 gnl/MRDRNA2_/MRDRNA2_69402_c0~~gnl/MRDRNA2_/MRDRNA2_69402_c0_seq1.p1  ORF type:complete len:298 (-),score=48.96 gnl/MRDRNA2_/MRDRNA2_69402_c0_seq1:164-1057(-)